MTKCQVYDFISGARLTKQFCIEACAWNSAHNSCLYIERWDTATLKHIVGERDNVLSYLGSLVEGVVRCLFSQCRTAAEKLKSGRTAPINRLLDDFDFFYTL